MNNKIILHINSNKSNIFITLLSFDKIINNKFINPVILKKFSKKYINNKKIKNILLVYNIILHEVFLFIKNNYYRDVFLILKGNSTYKEIILKNILLFKNKINNFNIILIKEYFYITYNGCRKKKYFK